LPAGVRGSRSTNSTSRTRLWFDALGHPGHQRAAVQLVARHDEGDRRLAAALVGPPDDGARDHRQVHREHGLELRRCHLQGVDLDQVRSLLV
jgi:hypothetical protein